MATKTPRGYRPTEPPEPARLTLDEFAQFKKLFEDSPLAFWIKAAGAGGIAAILALLIEIVRFFWK